MTVPSLRFKFDDHLKGISLSEVGRFYGGLSGKKKDDFGVGNSKFITYMNVLTNTIAKRDMCESVNVGAQEKQNAVVSGDVIFTQSSETAEEVGMASVWIHHFNVYLNSFSFGFRLFDKKGIDPVYLAYLMRSHAYRKKISMQAQGISRYNLSSSRLSSIKINIPEIREQQKIAEFFMSLDEKIAITEKVLNKSEIISSNILAKVYSGDIRFKQADGSSFPDWEKRQLSQLLRFQNGINASKNKFGSGTKLISVKEVLRDFPVTYDSITSSVEVDEKEAQRFSVEYGDVLFQRSSETAEEAGSANVYLDCRPAVFGGFVIRGKKTTDYQPQFLKMALRSPAVRQQIVRLAQGAQHFNIGQEHISTVEIQFPCLEEQEKIAELVTAFEDKKAAMLARLNSLQRLKQAFMQQMFI